jgi:hypothetical protein
MMESIIDRSSIFATIKLGLFAHFVANDEFNVIKKHLSTTIIIAYNPGSE